MATDLTPIFVWIAGQALADTPIEQMVAGLGERLNEAGLDIARAHVSTSTLHPMVSALSVTWHPDAAPERFDVGHGVTPTEAWLRSPLHHMQMANLNIMRQRLDRPNEPFDFPVFEEFAAAGMTEWIAFREGFDWISTWAAEGQFGLVASLTTRRPGGFSDETLPHLMALTKPIAAAVKSRFVTTIARDVLAAYLGRDAASRVLTGNIVRGGVTESPAVVMMADIKGFTHFSNTRPIAEVVALLNDSFDRIAGIVGRHGGEVLKFIGDGALAIFLLENRAAADVAAEALAAAEEIQAASPPGLGMSIGLNIGDVHYGNVGAAGRLDFTAIGPAVNEVARLEALCGTLGRPTLLSGALAAVAPDAWRARLTSIGTHTLKGFDEPREVFAL
ncbi:hypothetical protein sos41_15510 [Alphaproteobacteria bacterium SO-S41]|nr:hypothetical protein sos41_15510 [Alphaproteobacteria bacterium SO-S41]